MKSFQKLGAVAFSFVIAGSFVACGDDSGTKTQASEGALSAETFDDLPNCVKSREGEIATVEEDGLTYVCKSGKWEEYEEPMRTYSSEEDLPSCGKKNDGARALVGSDLYACSDRQWIMLATTYTTEEDLPNCTSKREGTKAYLIENNALLTCSDGEWVSPEGSTDEPGEGSSDGESGSSADEKSSSSVFCWDDDCSGLNASSSSKEESSNGSDVGSSTDSSSSNEFDGKNSSSSVAEESSSSVKQKVVEFEDGVLWKPGYGDRVHTFDDGLDEYNFLEDTTRVGTWFTDSDRNHADGSSTASITYGDNYMTIKHNLVYDNWVKEDGRIHALPEPYAMAAFFWGARGASDLSGQTGICLVYTADKEFRLDMQSKGSPYDYWDAPILASSAKRTANIKFKNLPATWWQENSTTITKALSQMYTLSLETPYYNKVHCYESKVSDCERQTYANTIKLYMIGEYGKCPDYNTYEVGGKQVNFVDDNLLWVPSYTSEDGTGKVRTYFGDVDEYNFYTGDLSGWFFTYDDKNEGGTSSAAMSVKDDYLLATLKLVYNWSGSGKSIEPNPYPYAAFGFNWSADSENGNADLTQLGTGICLEYTATRNFDVKLELNKNGDGRWVHTLAASSSRKVVNLKFNDTDFSQYDWQPEYGSAVFSDDIKKVIGLHFEYMSSQANSDITWCTEANASDCDSEIITNTVKLYKLGKYGTCN